MAASFSFQAVACLTACIVFAIPHPNIVFAQDCTPADIALISQADVDNFQANFGPCDHVTGELKIEGDDISSLSGLSELKQINRLDVLNNPLLANFQGLSSLAMVSGLYVHLNPSLTSLQGATALDRVDSLYIAWNERLSSMKGLETVERVGYLTISGNSSLRDMEGLSSLTRVGANWFEISDNSALESLDGLESLDTVIGNLIIQDNNALTNIDGLSSLTTATITGGYNVEIQRNAALLNLDGLSSLSALPGSLIIHLNDSLSDISGLSNLTEIGVILHIAANPVLADLDGLGALTTVGSLGIINNATLADISGLSHLETVEHWFEIRWNPILTDLAGLTTLTTVGTSPSMSFLAIASNATLNTLDGLSALQEVQNLVIEDNPSLADCQGIIRLIDPMDDFEPGPGPGISGIPDVGDQARIQNNLDDCNSASEILGKAPLFEMNAGLNDAWFNPDINGQGFLIIVFPMIEQVFVSWFTYDTQRPPPGVIAHLGEPGHRWITAQGAYVDNVAQLPVYIAEGGIFDSPVPVPELREDGEILLEFTTCNEGTVTYDFPSIDRQGVVPIERITLDNVPLCYFLDKQAAPVNIGRPGGY